MSDYQTLNFEVEGTRISVVVRNALALAAFGIVVGGLGFVGLLNGGRWGDLLVGIGVGLLLASGWLGADALRLRDRDVPSIVSK